MSKSTTYTVQAVEADGSTTDLGDPVSRLDKAKELATAASDGTKAIQVVTGAGNVSFTVPATEDLDAEAEELVATSNRSKPWTRVDSADYAKEFAGYELAYTRKRTQQGIYRATDKSGWGVYDARDDSFREFANTTEARQWTNQVTAEYNEKVKAEREQARVDRAAAREAKKTAREQEKAAALAEKEADKASKAAAKEQAETEKELDGANA